MSACNRCTMLPALPIEASTLSMQVRAGYLQAKLLTISDRAAFHCFEELPGILTCDLDEGQLDLLFDSLQSELTIMEQQAVHCAFNTRGNHLHNATTVANATLSAILAQRRN